MFDSLDEQMQKDENRVTTSGQRMMRYALYVLAAAVVMGGLGTLLVVAGWMKLFPPLRRVSTFSEVAVSS